MADGELNWKMWSEMCLRELSQLRLDINRHLTEHREDVTRLNNRIDSLSEKFQEMTKQMDNDRRDADEKQNLAIQSLQINAEHAGKAAGAEAGAAKAKEEDKSLQCDRIGYCSRNYPDNSVYYVSSSPHNTNLYIMGRRNL